MQISSAFDGGNINVLDLSDPGDIRLEIIADQNSACYQWFYFRLVGAKGMDCRLNIINAGGAYAGGWQGYRTVVSNDRCRWTRTKTTYNDGTLTISHTPETNSTYFAYFAPYSMERHADLIATALSTGLADLEVLGATLDGQNLDLITVGEPGTDKLVFWITARQHPGETMAEWWMEGFLERLLDRSDKSANLLRDEVDFYLVPNMNPDGSRRGHLRTNAAGIDLNRAWAAPNIEQSPEVYWVRKRLIETKPDLCLDVHGVEDTPHVFIVGPEGPAGYLPVVAGLLEKYKQMLLQASADFQTTQGFPIPAPEEAELTIGSNYLGETLKCLCMTLEMPFKDTSHNPDEHYGWSPERCRQMGRDNLTAMAAMIDVLKEARK